MFVGREKEKQRILDCLASKKAVLVYGLRRVGKTMLVKESLREAGMESVYFECMKASEEDNVSALVDVINTQFGESFGRYDTFKQVFDALVKAHPNIIIAIDEYSYMKEYYLASKKSDTNLKAIKLDSEFQTIIDGALPGLKLILCGSSISIMSGLLEYGSPLYDRFDLTIDLEPFSYLDSSLMLDSLSKKEIIEAYSIFGGSPYVLSKFDASKSNEENIVSLLLDPDGEVRRHIDHNALSELSKDPDLNKILSFLKNGDKKYGEIERVCKDFSNGLLDKRLKKLLELGIVEKKYPIDHEGDRRKVYYTLKDNLLKFYYSYIFAQENRISLLGGKRYFELYVKPSLGEFVSRRFESIVRDYFSLKVKAGHYEEIADIGSYFSATNEFDCVYKKRDGTYVVFEVKYLKSPMTKGMMLKEIEQVKQIKGLNISEIGFACSSGFKDKIEGCSYLELDELFSI